MTDTAALGIAVDSSAVAKADAALDALVQAARPADAAIAKLTASFSASSSSANAYLARIAAATEAT